MDTILNRSVPLIVMAAPTAILQWKVSRDWFDVCKCSLTRQVPKKDLAQLQHGVAL
jgi:hypothetical protein